ncbi:unnamed protein product, partial [Laminaria digitata]
MGKLQQRQQQRRLKRRQRQQREQEQELRLRTSTLEETEEKPAKLAAAAASHAEASRGATSPDGGVTPTPLSSSGRDSAARGETGAGVTTAKRAAEEEEAAGAPEKHQKMAGAPCQGSTVCKEKEVEGEEGGGDGGGGGSDDDDDIVQFPAKPPPPILPTSANPETAAAAAGAIDLAQAAKSGLFDSCPSSAGVAGFAGEKSSALNPPPRRSLSDGPSSSPSSSFGRSNLTVTAKKSLAAAAAAAVAWSLGRKKLSPRPRPPLSPGPAALSQTTPSRSPTRALEASALTSTLSATSPGGRGPVSALAAAAAAAAVAGSLEGARGSERPSSASATRSASAAGGPARVSPRAATIGGKLSPRSSPFVPAVELSPEVKLATTPLSPGPRPTETAVFYQRRPGGIGLPPASRAYLGRPEGFFVHVLVASALTAADLEARASEAAEDGVEHRSRVYYSFDERGKVAAALQPGDVVLLTPGRYEARAWGLQQLVSSVEIIGAGGADACVVYNNPAPGGPAAPSGEHYLVGVMGGAVLGVGDGSGAGGEVPEVKGKNNIDDDSDSGWEDGATGSPASSGNAFGGSAVRVRLANLTLEQGSGYRGAVYQVGRESHLEMDGCVVRCKQGGVNVDQGTCLLCDSTVVGSQTFGVHIGGEGTVEHCSVRDCGREGGGGGGRGRKGAAARARGGGGAGGAGAGGGAGGGSGTGEGGRDSPSGSPTAAAAAAAGGAGVDSDEGEESEDDGTDVNRKGGMPAISILQSSRVRVRFNVIRDNAGHALQCRDAPLPGGDEKHAMLARRAEVEAEE